MTRPEAVGLARAKLDALRDLVGGRGCVVRHGYMVYSWGEKIAEAKYTWLAVVSPDSQARPFLQIR